MSELKDLKHKIWAHLSTRHGLPPRGTREYDVKKKEYFHILYMEKAQIKARDRPDTDEDDDGLREVAARRSSRARSPSHGCETPERRSLPARERAQKKKQVYRKAPPPCSDSDASCSDSDSGSDSDVDEKHAKGGKGRAPPPPPAAPARGRGRPKGSVTKNKKKPEPQRSSSRH